MTFYQGKESEIQGNAQYNKQKIMNAFDGVTWDSLDNPIKKNTQQINKSEKDLSLDDKVTDFPVSKKVIIRLNQK